MAVRAREHGDAMPPPQLARDAPVPEVLHPVEVIALEALRHEAGPPFAHGGDRRARKLRHAEVPLLHEQRLHLGVTALAVPNRVHVRADLRAHEPLRAQLVEDGLARLVPIQAGVRPGVLVHPAVEPDHRDGRQAVPLTDLEVDGVVRRRHLQRAGPEVLVDRLVGHDRQLAVHDRKDGRLADQVLVAPVGRVHGHAGVGEHRLDARRRDRDVTAAVFERVLQLHELAGGVLVFHLDVRQRGHVVGAPVGDPVAAIDQAFVVKAHEHRSHGEAALLVHGEALARPVDGVPEPPHLPGDRAARLFLPLPDARDERFTAEVVTRRPFLGQLALHHVLGRDPGVIHPRQPQRAEPLHPFAADDRVLDRVIERVPDVERPRHVRRREHDTEGLALAGWGEESGLFPLAVETVLHRVRVVALLKLSRHSSPLETEPGPFWGPGSLSPARAP